MPISTAVDASAVARVLGIQTIFKNLRGGILFLPQRIAVVGQGNTASVYDTTKRQVTSASEAASIYGFGSPIHNAVRQLFPVNGDGVGTIPVTIYPLEDDASGVASSGDITPSVTPTEAASYLVRINNIDSEEFVIETTDTVADRNDKNDKGNQCGTRNAHYRDGWHYPKDDTNSKWEGTSANDIVIEVIGLNDCR